MMVSRSYTFALGYRRVLRRLHDDRMMYKCSKFGVLLLLSLLVINAYGQQSWNFSGFATLGAGKTNRDSYQFIEYDGEWSFDSDTVIGLQLVAHPLDRISFTGQVVARGYNFDSDQSSFEPELEWAFASIDLYEYGRLRLGRLRTPYQYFSESLEVGYSYVWVRPPVDVYAFAFDPFTHYEGVDYSFNLYPQDFNLELKALYGETKGNYLINTIDISRMLGVSATGSWDNFVIRYGFIDHDLSVYSDLYKPLISALEQASLSLPFANDLDLVADRLTIDNGTMPYHNLTLDWRLGKWNFIAEGLIAKPPKKGLLSYINAWYLSLSHELGQYTPYLTVGSFDFKLENQVFQEVDRVFSAAYQAAGQLNPELQSLQQQTYLALESYSNSQRSYALGLRYEFHPKIALKGEIQYLELLEDSPGQLVPKNFQDPTINIADATIITLVMDVIF